MRYPDLSPIGVAGTLMAAVLAAGACRDMGTTAPPEAGPLASFAGARVEGTSLDFAVRVSDPASGLSVYAGGTAEEFAAYCATGSFEADSRWQDLAVTRPRGALHAVDKGRPVPVVVYRAVYYEVCDGTAPVYATGTADIVSTDNDYYLAGPGGESFGFQGSGIVTASSGERLRLHLVARVIIHPDGSYQEASKVSLTQLH
jgi:hypothetical protein